MELHALLQIFQTWTEYCMEKMAKCYLHNMQYVEHMVIMKCEEPVATLLWHAIGFFLLVLEGP